MAAKKSRNATRTKRAKAPSPKRQARTGKPTSPRATALGFVRTRIVQYECDLELLRALEVQLAGTGGRALASSRIVKSARAAGWLQE